MEFWLIYNVKPPRTNPNPPRRTAKPPIENFLATVLPPVLTQKGWYCFVTNKTIKIVLSQNKFIEAWQFSLFMHPDQAQNTSSGIQGQEATAVAVIYVTAPTSSRKTTKYK